MGHNTIVTMWYYTVSLAITVTLLTGFWHLCEMVQIVYAKLWFHVM